MSDISSMGSEKFVIQLFTILIVVNLSGLNDFISEKFALQALLSPLILLIIAIILGLFASRNRLEILSEKEIKLFLVPFLTFLIVGALVSLFQSELTNLARALRYYLPSILIYWVGVFGFSLLLHRYKIVKVVKTLRWILLINVLVIIYSYFDGGSLINIGGGAGRFAGLLLNANQAGFAGAMLLVMELYLLGTGASRISKFIIPMVLFAIFLTFSRTAFIITPLVAALFLWDSFFGKNRSITTGIAIISILAALVLGYFLFFEDYFNQFILTQSTRVDEFNALVEGEFNDQTTGHRTLLARVGLELIYQKPIFGHGLYTFIRFNELGSGVHNQYLLIWGEAGIFALLAYLWYLVTLWIRVDAKIGLNAFLVRGLVVCIAVYSLTNHNMYGNKTVMIILALISVIILYSRYVRDIRITWT